MTQTIAEVTAALSSTRVEILMLLTEDRSFAELAAHVGIARSTLTYHLNILEDANLIVVSQDGTRKCARLKYKEIRIPLIFEPIARR